MSLLNGAVYNEQALNQTNLGVSALSVTMASSATVTATISSISFINISVTTQTFRGPYNSVVHNSQSLNTVFPDNQSSSMTATLPDIKHIYVTPPSNRGVLNSTAYNSLVLNGASKLTMAGNSSMAVAIQRVATFTAMMNGSTFMGQIYFTGQLAFIRGGYNSFGYMAAPYNDSAYDVALIQPEDTTFVTSTMAGIVVMHVVLKEFAPIKTKPLYISQGPREYISINQRI